METDTPETDAFGNRPREWPDFARRLERERDEARRKLEFARSLAGELMAAIRVNAIRGTWKDATPEEVDAWLSEFAGDRWKEVCR